ncbi:MAG: hypothetical protein NTZ19_10875 [Bacteroidetes bacterium]|nr:hypothetical protein [Bacteroidota bacterium]
MNKRYLYFLLILFISIKGFAQDTVFINVHSFEEPINNVDGDGKNLIARSDTYLYHFINGNFKKIATTNLAKGRFTWLSQSANPDLLQTYCSDIINPEKNVSAKENSKFLPGYFVEGLTKAKIGNKLFICYRGTVLEYQIRNYYKIEHKSESIRSIYVDDSIRVIAGYSGIYVDSIYNVFTTTPIRGAYYSNGEVNKIGNSIYINYDNLGVYDGHEIKDAIKIHDKFKFRKLISYQQYAIYLTDFSVGRLDLKTNSFIDTLLTNIIGFNDADILGDNLYVAAENGKLYCIPLNGGKQKSFSISEKPIYHINNCIDTFYISGQDGLYKFIPNSEKTEKILTHSMVIQSLCVDKSLLFTTYKGMYLYNDNKVYEIIRNVEFNKRSMFKYDKFIYVGSVEGLYLIDWPLVKLDLIPGLTPTILNKIRIRYYKRKGFLNSCKDGEFDESFVVKHH